MDLGGLELEDLLELEVFEPAAALGAVGPGRGMRSVLSVREAVG